MVAARLVEQHREGRLLRCLPVNDALDQTLGFVTEQCDVGSCEVPRSIEPGAGRG